MTPSSFYLSWQNLLFLHFSGRFVRVLDLMFIAVARLAFHPWVVRNLVWALAYFNCMSLFRAGLQLLLLVLNPLAKLTLVLVRRLVHKKVAYFPSYTFSFPALVQLYLPVVLFTPTQRFTLKTQSFAAAVGFSALLVLSICVLF